MVNYPLNLAEEIIFSVYAGLVVAPYHQLLSVLDSVRVRLPISPRSQDIFLKALQTLFQRTLFSPFLAMLWVTGIILVGITAIAPGMAKICLWIFGGMATVGVLLTSWLVVRHPDLLRPVPSEDYRLKHEQACMQIASIRLALSIPASHNDVLRGAIETIMKDEDQRHV